MKYADLLSKGNRHAESLPILDGLVEDIENKIYSDVYSEINWKDIANVYWNVCAPFGETQKGLSFLRKESNLQKGTRFEARIRETFIQALTGTGHLEEADSQISELSSLPNIDPKTVQRLRDALALAKWRHAHPLE